MSKANEILKAFEVWAEDKTVKEIREMIQEAIEKAERDNPNIDITRIVELFYLIERHLVERAKENEVIRN